MVDNTLTTKWLNRLRDTAHNNESREMQSQLSSILDYYNKQSHGTEGLSPIDWSSYEKTIHTPDIVSKIHDKYNEFMEAEYQIDGAVSKCGFRSELMKQLDAPMQYNYQLWLTHYMMHLDQIETMHNIGDPTELSAMEMTELHSEVNVYNSMQQETGNLAPQDLIENSVPIRIATQFSWGSRYSPPFTHSNDSITTVVASLSKLGK